MKGWFPSCILLLSLVACTSALTPASSSPSPSLWDGVTPIGEITADPQAYEGQEVVVLAYYRGWDLFGETGVGPPLTRSDVAVADATGALYIVSAEGFEGFEGAPGLPPQRPDATEVLLRIRGVVRLAPAGQPYLEVIEGEAVEGLPWGVVLRVRRFGTILGLNEELMVMEDGTAYFLDRKVSYSTRFSVDPAEVREVLDRLAEHLSEGEIGTPIPDTAVYRVTAWDGEKVRSLLVYETGAFALSEVLGTVDGWCAQAREGAARPDIQGAIVEIRPLEGDALGTIRVEGSIAEGTEYDKALVTVTEATEIVGEDGRPVRFDALRVGQRVEVTFTGPVLESYPVQATAGRIVVLTAAAPSPGVSPLPSPGMSPLLPPESAPVSAAVERLAAELGVPPDQIGVVSAEQVEWPDASLGCPEPGMMYAQVITPGYRILLEVEGTVYAVHTDATGEHVIVCRR